MPSDQVRKKTWPPRVGLVFFFLQTEAVWSKGELIVYGSLSVHISNITGSIDFRFHKEPPVVR